MHNLEKPLPKPPIGLRPEKIAYFCRVKEIIDAMERYSKESVPIPMEWVDELKRLINKEIL